MIRLDGQFGGRVESAIVGNFLGRFLESRSRIECQKRAAVGRPIERRLGIGDCRRPNDSRAGGQRLGNEQRLRWKSHRRAILGRALPTARRGNAQSKQTCQHQQIRPERISSIQCHARHPIVAKNACSGLHLVTIGKSSQLSRTRFSSARNAREWAKQARKPEIVGGADGGAPAEFEGIRARVEEFGTPARGCKSRYARTLSRRPRKGVGSRLRRRDDWRFQPAGVTAKSTPDPLALGHYAGSGLSRQPQDPHDGGRIRADDPGRGPRQEGKVELLVGLDHELTPRRRSLDQRCEQSQDRPLLIGKQMPRRRAEDQPGERRQLGHPPRPEQHIGRQDRRAVGDGQLGDILPNDVGRRKMALDEGRAGCPAAERFEPQRAPVPANRSMAWAPLTAGPIRLNSASRIRSFMGRTRGSPL